MPFILQGPSSFTQSYSNSATQTLSKSTYAYELSFQQCLLKNNHPLRPDVIDIDARSDKLFGSFPTCTFPA